MGVSRATGRKPGTGDRKDSWPGYILQLAGLVLFVNSSRTSLTARLGELVSGRDKSERFLEPVVWLPFWEMGLLRPGPGAEYDPEEPSHMSLTPPSPSLC